MADLIANGHVMTHDWSIGWIGPL